MFSSPTVTNSRTVSCPDVHCLSVKCPFRAEEETLFSQLKFDYLFTW